MENTTLSKSRNFSTLFLLISRFFLSFAHFGLSGIIGFLLTKEFKQYPSHYTIFYVVSFMLLIRLISQLIGGMLADLGLGNKKTTFIGMAIALAGIISLIIWPGQQLIAGYIMLNAGISFCYPNINAWIIKGILGQNPKLDSILTLLFTLTNIGAVVGTIVLFQFVESQILWSYSIGAMAILISIPLIFFSQEVDFKSQISKIKAPNRKALIALIFLAYPVFFISINIRNHI